MVLQDNQGSPALMFPHLDEDGDEDPGETKRRASAAVYQDAVELPELNLVKTRIKKIQKQVLNSAHTHISSMLSRFDENEGQEKREVLENSIRENLERVYDPDQLELELKRIVKDLMREHTKSETK